MDKVLSRHVHHALRLAFDPVLHPLGFVRTPGTSWCSYTIERADGWQTCWAQLNRWGWQDVVGSALTLEFQLADEPAPGSGGVHDRVRWTDLSSPADLREARLRQEAIAASARPSPDSDPELVEEARLVDSHLGKLDVEWQPGLDVWLRYCRVEHVDDWAEFLARRLPTMVERHLNLC